MLKYTVDKCLFWSKEDVEMVVELEEIHWIDLNLITLKHVRTYPVFQHSMLRGGK